MSRPTPASPESPETRICTQCEQHLPIERFRRRFKDRPERHPACNDCRQDKRQGQRADQRRRALQTDMRLIRKTRSPARIQSIVDAMVVRFGGVNQLVDQWLHLIETAPQESYRLKALTTLVHMLTVLDASRLEESRQRHERTLRGQLTAEEIRELDGLGEEELLDRLAIPLRTLQAAGHLDRVLQFMIERGELCAADLLAG